MANRKRDTPLTDEERKARNRKYQHTRRHKTDNNYSRAYRRAGQRAIKWFQQNKESTWHTWLKQEQEVLEVNPYSPGAVFGKDGAAAGSAVCIHDGDKTIIGLTVGCDLCGKAVGSVSLDEDVRQEMNEQFSVD